jgi:FKBP-type peptidyl-prolyl cis-trans isomerase
MKNKHLLIYAILIAVMVFGTCRNANSNPFAGTENLDRDASYALGMSIGYEFLETMFAGGIIPNVDEFVSGMRDVLSGADTRLNMSDAMEKLDSAFNLLMEQMGATAMQDENIFLAENARRPGIIITQSGLQYEIITMGNGPRPNATDTVRVHYEGTFIDGSLFDSSHFRGVPAEFPLDMVIPGWTEGIQLMPVGSEFIFYIPSNLGYGPMGGGPIPPYSTLIFTVELLEIIN